MTFPASTPYTITPLRGGSAHAFRAAAGARVTLPAGVLRLPAGAAVPVVERDTGAAGQEWATPVGGSGQRSPVFVYSLLIATFLGTMGLPHILVRFYTNPDGPAARHTTVRVLGLLGLFYLFPGIYGALGRALTPQLYITGSTDTVVLRLPQAAWPGTVGNVLGAVTAAGAFAAFLSTSSGLLVSISGTISHDVWPRLARESATTSAIRRRRFRIAAALGHGRADHRRLLRTGDRHRPARGVGVRAGRQHLLSAVPARDLVAGPDRRGRRGRHGRGRRSSQRAGIIAGSRWRSPTGSPAHCSRSRRSSRSRSRSSR